jgi:hypothetical protein
MVINHKATISIDFDIEVVGGDKYPIEDYIKYALEHALYKETDELKNCFHYGLKTYFHHITKPRVNVLNLAVDEEP